MHGTPKACGRPTGELGRGEEECWSSRVPKGVEVSSSPVYAPEASATFVKTYPCAMLVSNHLDLGVFWVFRKDGTVELQRAQCLVGWYKSVEKKV